MIKYDIFGIDITEESSLKMIESIQIKFTKEETRDLISRHIIRQLSGKFSFTVDNDGSYKICTQNIVSSWIKNNKRIYMNIKIETDNQDEVDLNKIVRKEDLDPISDKINKIIKKSQKIIRKQANEIQSEDETYLFQQSYTKLFVLLTIIQTIVVLVVGLYHIISFRKFLISHKVISKNT